MPNSDDSGWRQALGTITGVERLMGQISSDKTAYIFFDQLLKLLIFEGKTTLVSFLSSIVNSDLIGPESKDRLNRLVENVQSLTNDEWEQDLERSTNTHTRSPVRFVLPQLDVSTFTGREEQLQRLESLLLNSQGSKVCSIVGLSGSGGIGKSALAFHFATIHRDKFPGGVIGLRVDGKDVNTIARDFVRQLGEELDAEDERDAATLMQEVFAHRQMLLIFDNAVEATIKKLRPGGSRCAVIITTRNRTLSSSLDISDDGAIDLNPLPQEDCLKLLKKILGDERVNAELAATYEIIGLVGNLPLALQIVGAALRGRPRIIADYAASLKQEKTRLSRLKIQGDDDLNVEASLNLSLELLSEEEKNFFACLSVCAKEGFARRTAMATGGCEDEWEANDYLDRLYQLSLLNYTETGENRFVLHPLVGVYAESLAQERDVLSVAHERHSQFFVEWLKSDNLESPKVVAEVAANLDDVILAVEWLQIYKADTEQSKMETYQFALKLQPLLEQYGYWQKAITLMERFQSWAEQFQDWEAVVKYKIHEARYWSFSKEFERGESILHSAQTALQKIDALDIRKRREAKLLNVLGGVFEKQGKKEEAIQTFRDEILIEEEIGDDRALAIVCNRLGRLLQTQEKLEEAQQAFERQIAIAQALTDQSSLAIGLNCLGGLLQQQGKLEKAQQAFERQIAIAQALNDQSSLAIGLNCLRGVLQQQGNVKEALVIARRWVAIEKELGVSRRLTMALTQVSQLLKAAGQVPEAITTLECIAQIEEELEKPRGIARTLISLYNLQRKHEYFDDAYNTLLRILAIEEKLNNQKGMLWSLANLGYIGLQKNNLDLAIEYYERACELSKKYDNTKKSDSILKGMGIAFHQYGTSLLEQRTLVDKALEVLKISQKIFTDLNVSSQVAWVWHSLGRAWKLKGEFEEAEILLKRSQEFFEDEKDWPSLAKVLNTLGGVLERQQKWEESEEILRQSYDLAEKLNDKLGQAIIANSLGQVIAKQKGNEAFENSQMYFRQSIKLGEELDDQNHLAKVHTAMGQAFLAHDFFDQAVEELSKGFEIDERLSNVRGLRIVTPNLTYALSKLRKQEKALEYCDRALKIAPNDPGFLQLHDKIQTAISTGIQQIFIKTGLILYIERNERDNLRWGRIAPDDGSSNIIFNEKFIGAETISKLIQGALVEVEVKENYGKLYATQIRVIKEE
jgi:tetratricopeptide (TPR) repeat protein